MKKKLADNQAACDYAAYNLRDSRLLPISLLRRYSDLDLTEKELIRLLRLISCCYNSGHMTLSQVTEEFGVDKDEATALMRPFIDRRLIEYDKAADSYGCEGLRRELYLLWFHEVRDGSDLTEELTGLELPPEREELRALAHLYRRFEQELGRPLKYTESDRLRSWVDDEAVPPELIEEALKRAALRDKCSMAYIGSILKSWQKKHLTTLSMVLEQDVPEVKEQVPSAPTRAAKNSSKYQKVKIN